MVAYRTSLRLAHPFDDLGLRVAEIQVQAA